MPILVEPASGPSGGRIGSVYDPVQLGEVIFGQTDSYGVDWILEEFSGWHDGVDSTAQGSQRPATDGWWMTSALRGGRVLTLKGTAVSDSWDTAEAARNRLLTAIPLRTPEPLTVYTPTPLQAWVQQLGQPLAKVFGETFAFSLSLQAPDPLRYAVSEQSASTGLPQTIGGMSLPLSLPLSIGATVASGRLAVANAGNAATPPRFEIAGPVPAGARVTLVSSGASLYIPHEVPAGRTLILDAASQTALLDGTAPRLVTGVWFHLPGSSVDNPTGADEVAFSAPSFETAALLTAHWRSAYL